MNRIPCAHCGNDFLPNPRVKNQRYCNGPACQRGRKSLWQRQKLAEDPDYRANQRDCWKSWRQRHPAYWQQYRKQHPRVQERNRLLQRVRNAKRLPTRRPVIANMDSLSLCFSIQPGPYYLVPPIANMDPLANKFFIIPAP